MDDYPKSLIDQYLKTCNKLKKVEKAVFKRFRPNIAGVLDDFGNLAQKFEKAAVYQYAAMCQLGMAKCQAHLHDSLGECHSILRAARLYLRAHEEKTSLLANSINNEYREAAIHSYAQAVEKCPDDGVLKAAIIREMTPLQSNYEGTSSLDSPAHRIYEMVSFLEKCILERSDHVKALQLVDDIIDNIYERKRVAFYEDLLRELEVYRVLLLIAMNVPPARQTPAHVELLEYYLKVANFEIEYFDETCKETENDNWEPGQWLIFQHQCDLAEVVINWHQHRTEDLKLACQEFLFQYTSITPSQRCLLKHIIKKCK